MDSMLADSRDEPQMDFVYCWGAATEVLKFGPRHLHSGHKVLVLVVPGESDDLHTSHCTSSSNTDAVGKQLQATTETSSEGRVEHRWCLLVGRVKDTVTS